MGRALQRYKKLFDGLRTGNFRPLYFLYGPEEYMKKEFVAALVAAALSEGNRAFNLDILYGDDFDADRFHDRISSFPLFTDRRVVIIKKFDALTTASKDVVIGALPHAADSVITVVESIADKMETARHKALKKLTDENGVSCHFQYLSDEETVERIKARLRREGMAIEPDALDLLVESVGTHLGDLVNELEKIILRAGDAERISRETVASVVGKYRVENLFSLLDQLGNADTSSVVSYLGQIIDSGEEPVYILAMLIRRILQLLEIKTLTREEGPRLRNSAAMAGRMAGFVSPFYAGKLLQQAKRFDEPELLDYLDNLRWADAKIKSTALRPQALIETSLLASAMRKRLAQPVV